MDVELLEQVAAQLAVRVRDDDPDANGRWLASMLPDPADWWRLAFVLASAVPDDQSWRSLTSWARPDEPPAPSGCGTTGGYRRHTRRGEPPCGACRNAEAARARRRRALARAA